MLKYLLTKFKTSGIGIFRLRISRRRRLLVLSTVATFLLVLSVTTILASRTAKADWFDDAWHYRKKLVVDHTKVSGTTDLTNFPVLVSRTDTDFINKAQSDGDDFIFTDIKGIKLDHEIEKYDSGTGELIAWVRFPTLYAQTSSVIYLYYGNTTASAQKNVTGVWDSNYKAVQHLEEGTTGNTDFKDSTSNYNHSTNVKIDGAGSSATATGIIGTAVQTDGTDDYIRLPVIALGGNTGTMSGWGKLDSANPANNMRIFGRYWQNDSIGMRNEATDRWVGWFVNGSATDWVTTLDTNWHYITLTYDGSLGSANIKLYVDGQQLATGNKTGSFTYEDRVWQIGTNGSAGDYWDGIVDEIRLSNIPRSADWIATEFNNQDSPSTFFSTVGSEEKGNSPALFLTFDEGYGNTTQDQTSNNNDGSISGAAWKTQDICLSENCLFFDGTDDVVTVTNASSIDFDTQLAGGMTFQGWIRVNSDGEGNVGEIYDKGDAASDATYLRVTNEGSDGLADLEASLALGTNGATDDATVTVTNGISLNKWHYVAVAYTDDGDDEITVYIDGKSRATSTNGTGAPETTDTSNLLIGGSSAANFHGFIDEFKVYNSERTAAQIKTDSNRSSTSKGATASFGDTEPFLSEGLVGYWKMDDAGVDAEGETSTDSSGNGNTGTLYGDNGVGDNGTGLDCTVSGKYGTGCDLDGTDDYVKISTTVGGNFDRDQITFSTWFYPHALSTGTIQRIFQRATSTWGMYLNGSTSALWFYVDTTDDGGSFITSIVTIPSTNQWYHAVGTYDGNNIKLYLNGVLMDTDAQTGLIDNGARAYVSIGSSDETPSQLYNGVIDDARVYNRALSGTEVSQLYNWSPGPVAYWKFDESSGGYSYDSSGNSFTGTNTSIDWVNGKYGGAAKLNNTSDQVTVSHSDTLTFTNAMTYSAWISPTSLSGNQIVLTKRGASWVGYELVFWNSYANLDVRARTGDCGTSDVDHFHNTGGISLNTWTHIAFTYDANGGSNNMRFYKNGVLISSNTVTGNLCTNTSDLYMNSATEPFSGGLDDVRLYNYARTPQQIVEDMNAGHPAPGSPVGSATAHWSMDEGYSTSVRDQSVNNITGSFGAFNGGTNPTWSNSGKFGKAVNFDSTQDQYVNFGDPSSGALDFGTDDFTISLWFNTTQSAGTGDWPQLIRKVSGSPAYGYEIGLSNTDDPPIYIYFKIWNNSSSAAVSTPTAVNDGAWHHVVGVKTATTVTMYLDGEYIDYDSHSLGTVSNSANLYLGTNDATNWSEYNGKLDEIKIFNSALTADQVKLLYNQSSSAVWGALSTDSSNNPSNSALDSYCPAGQGSSCTAPIAEWKMDEGSWTNNCSTDSVFDSSGNGNNGDSCPNGTGPTGNASGKSGNAGSFDGSDDNIRIADASSLRPTNITVTAWVYARNTVDQYIISKGKTSGDSYNFAINVFGGSGKVSWNSYNGSWVSIISSSTIPTNQWVHLAGTYDSSAQQMKFYINGVQEGSPASLSSIDYTGTTSLRIGSRSLWNDTATNYFNGFIDDVRIYNYARTPAQIAWDYNRGAPLAYWAFDECTGTNAYNTAPKADPRASELYTGTINPGDTSGNNDTAGTCSSGDATEMWNDGTTGKRNASLGFDGTNDYVDLGSSSVFNFTTQPFTISAWIKPIVLSSVSIISNDNTTSGYGVALSDGKLRFVTRGTNDVYTDSTNSISVSVWTHVVAVYTGTAGQRQLYINGNLNITEGFTGSITSALVNLFIGKKGNSTDYYSGQIDEVKIFNYALTSQQVKNLYSEGAVYFGPE